MHLKVRNVNEAFNALVNLFHTGEYGSGTDWRMAGDKAPIRKTTSRYGDVMIIDEPVIVTYTHPTEKVLFNSARDCNPFFHVYEALWMLAGRNDVTPLTYYNGKMKEFSDDGSTFNGAYGYRWRCASGKPELWIEGGKPGGYRRPGVDQLDILVDHLKQKPDSRRAVLQMWNVEDDLLKVDKSKDVACNLSVMFSLRPHEVTLMQQAGKTIGGEFKPYLDMTVTNRSNDLIWGMLGANVVHFAFLQEYMAARLDVKVGVYNQFTNNLHCYTKTWEPDKWMSEYIDYDSVDVASIIHGRGQIKLVPLVQDPVVFEQQLPWFIECNNYSDCEAKPPVDWDEPFLQTVAQPMCNAFHAHKMRDYTSALRWCEMIQADDWRVVCRQWLNKRRLKHEGK